MIGHAAVFAVLFSGAACGLGVVGEQTTAGEAAENDSGAVVTPPGTNTAVPDAAPAPTCMRADGGTTCMAWAACENGVCVDVARALVAFRQEILCGSAYGNYCNTGALPADLTMTLTGTPGATYALTIHVRGVLEQKTYNGADAFPATGANAAFLTAGGAANDDNWNIASMRVTAPSFTWHLNSGESEHDYSDPLDYRTTIAAAAGASVVLGLASADTRMAKNRDVDGSPITIAGIAPYAGQFVQVDVESVTRQ